MLDLNHILLFIACLSPLVLLARSWRGGGLDREWRMAAMAVLGVTALASVFVRRDAGFIAGGAWFALLLFPSIALRKMRALASRQRFGAAQRLGGVVRLFHPSSGLTSELEVLCAMQLAQSGDADFARDRLSRIASEPTAAGRQAMAEMFSLRRDWDGLVRWHAENIAQDDLSLAPSYLRALGETGALDELIHQFAARWLDADPKPDAAAAFQASVLMLLAFCGRTDSLVRFLASVSPRFPPERMQFWIATSEIASGNVAAGRARLELLLPKTSDCVLRSEIEQRLAKMPPAAATISPAANTLLRLLERRQSANGSAFLGRSRTRLGPAVAVLLALNVAMFLLETAWGGSTNSATLHRLGALEPFAVFVRHEYWRLGTAPFLHYGVLHLAFNAYALYVLGPSLEASIGTMRFTACYLISGLGSSAGVVALWRLGGVRAYQLVGASGCVMGIVGAWAGLLLHHRDRPSAARRLRNIVLIVAMQTAFDLYTPQVSMAAHMSGLMTGLLVGYTLTGPRAASARG